jgi:hypothetical protein
MCVRSSGKARRGFHRAGISGNVVFARCIDGIESMATGQRIIDLRRLISFVRKEVLDEGNRCDGPGGWNGRDEAGGAARAAGSDKRRRRSGSCVGIHLDRADVALDLDRSSRS